MWQGQLRMLSSEQGSPNHLLSLTSGISITTSHWNSPDSFPPTFRLSALAPWGFPSPVHFYLPLWIGNSLGIRWEPCLSSLFSACHTVDTQ